MYRNGGKSFCWYLQDPCCPDHIISEENYSKIPCTISDFSHPLDMEHGILCFKEGHPLPLECSITFLRCIMMIRGASGSIYKTLTVNIMSLLLKTTPKFHGKSQVLETLSAQEMGCHATRRDIHCCLSIVYPSLDV